MSWVCASRICCNLYMWREISSNLTFCLGICTEAFEVSVELSVEISLLTYLGDSSVSVTDMLELWGSNRRPTFALEPYFDEAQSSPFEEAEEGGNNGI